MEYDILAIGAHPDDVELACGGSLMLAVQAGLKVAVLDLTAGEMATRGAPHIRAAEAAEAARLLGVVRLAPLGLADTGLGQGPDEAEALVAVLRQVRPRLVLGPVGPDRHPDHTAAATIVRRAVFLAGLPRHGTGESHRIAAFAAYPGHHPVAPGFVIDVTAVWEGRMAALRSYASQFGPVGGGGGDTALSGGDFLRAVEARAIHYGSMIGARYGEGFVLDGPVALGGLGALLGGRSSAYRCFL